MGESSRTCHVPFFWTGFWGFSKRRIALVKPLENCLVLDMTRVLAGPYCTMILGDLGARVIKLEVPEIGDDSRGFGPFIDGHSGYFMSVNRNKESMSLNIKTEEGKEIFSELVKKADVLVENYRPGTMEKMGFSFPELKKINPRLVYTSVSGYGHTGPYRHKPAYDIIVQALGGIMSITGEDKGGPVKIGASMGDITAGLFAAIGTLAALSHVDKGGEGQHVDISMLDSQVAILENAISRYFINGEIPGPIGNRHPSITPFCALPSADGNLVIAVGNDAMWEKFCMLLNRSDLLAQDKFKTNDDRTTHWEELKEILESIFSKRPTNDWLELLEEGGIPCAPIQSIDQVVSHPQILSRNMIVEFNHPEVGLIKVANNPIKFSNTPCEEMIKHPPLFGQHTDSILQELGYSQSMIEKFIENQVV